MADTMEYIKNGIKELYKTSPNIHMSVKLTHSKNQIESIPAKITGVYRNLFQVDEENRGHTVRHTFQYSEILIGNVRIHELVIPQTVSILNKRQSEGRHVN